MHRCQTTAAPGSASRPEPPEDARNVVVTTDRARLTFGDSGCTRTSTSTRHTPSIRQPDDVVLSAERLPNLTFDLILEDPGGHDDGLRPGRDVTGPDHRHPGDVLTLVVRIRVDECRDFCL